jgi:chemotaxis response regulator CheB
MVRPAAGKGLPVGHSGPMRPILIGASTGGVEALYTILGAMPSDSPPLFIVQHMRPHFMESFVASLDRKCRPRVVLAQDRMVASRGHVYVAPAGPCHLTLGSGPSPFCRLVRGEAVHGHRPSVDRLFLSSTQLSPLPVAALLTGMGRDGAEGLLRLRQSGSLTIAQDEESCVVFGMPRAAIELSAAEKILPLAAIAEALLAGAGYRIENTKGTSLC